MASRGDAVNGLALCAGIGGLELGVARAVPGYRTVGYIERDAYAAAVLVARMEDAALDRAPIWDDIATFDGAAWRGIVDIITAGFPCQPFSGASRGRRVAFDLWPDVFRVCREVRAAWVFLENVQREPIDRAGRELAGLGYRWRAVPISAAQVGAPHPRLRYWLLANADDEAEPAFAVDVEVAKPSPSERFDEWRRGPDRVLGMVDGLPYRMDRLRCLGNAVVPQQAELAFRVLWGRLNETHPQ